MEPLFHRARVTTYDALHGCPEALRGLPRASAGKEVALEISQAPDDCIASVAPQVDNAIIAISVA